MSVRILELVAENFKKLRVVEITPKGHIVPITGKNGQGKTSVLDALWFALKGKSALPVKAVRKGAEKMTVTLKTSEFTVTRTQTANGALPTLQLEMKPGFERNTTPQDFLDNLLGDLTFDPLEFVRMTPKERASTLRKAVKIDLDLDAMAAANTEDYKERTKLNRAADELKAQVDALVELAGLPEEKLDEEAILRQLNEAGEANRKQQEVFKAKQDLAGRVLSQRQALESEESEIERITNLIAGLEEQVKEAKGALKLANIQINQRRKSLSQAEMEHKAAPSGDPIDVAALTAELQSIQRTNRAIETRNQKRALQAKLDTTKAAADKLTQAMNAREDKKQKALAGAKVPIDGLTLDEADVLYKGLPLENLGEGEAIRISAEIGMALNPKLRVMRIPHGEALDEDGMAMLTELAEKNDFQIWMAKVDTSGKVGIVLEDGMVVARNEAD